MRTGTGWWLERSQADRFDLLTRGPLYLLSGAEPLAALLIVLGQSRVRPAGAVLLLVVVIAHTVACLRLLHAGIEHRLGRPARLRAPVAVTLGLTVAGAVAGLVAFPEPWLLSTPGPAGPTPGEIPLLLAVLLLFATFTLAALTPVLSRALLVGLVVLPAAAASLAQNALLDNPGAASWAGDVLVPFLAAAFTYRSNVWLLGMVWTIDRSRGMEARLAVAEERLRFSRDLHDVLGRNLALIAISSDLAVQLQRRGQDGAAEHMLEVHRTAQESIRELREVVHGYRTVDLGTELGGARSLLDAAGIDVVVTGIGSGGPAGSLPLEHQVALAWAVREAVTNIIRHSAATHAGIDLDVTDSRPQRVVLRIENDGVPTRDALSTAESPRGSGLSGVRERLAGLGGTLTARTATDERRFEVEATLPLVASDRPGSSSAEPAR